jgi:hypothetical protein
MALGTVAPVNTDPHNTQAAPMAVGDIKMAIVTVVGEASYVTGGSAITAQQLGFNSVIFAAQAEIQASTGSNCTSSSMAVIPATGGGSANLECFTNAGVQIASAVNVSGVTWQIIAFGN